METLQNLLARALVVMNEIKERQNTATRIGSLFRDIIQYIQNALLGIVFKGSKANAAAIQAITGAQRGDTYRADDTGHYWVWDGTQWNDIGEIIPANILEDVNQAIDDGISRINASANIQDIYNITVKIPLSSGFYTPITARAAVPVPIRKIGLIITYTTEESVWKTEQFICDNINDWNNEFNWNAISGGTGGNNGVEEYGTFPDEVAGEIDFINCNTEGWLLQPASVGTNSATDRNVGSGYQMFAYPVIPGRTYDVSFYANLATSVRVYSGLNFITSGRSIYDVPSDLGSAVLQSFTFTAGINDHLVAVGTVLSAGMPEVTGAKSRYYRFLESGKMELKPILCPDQNISNVDMGTAQNQNVGKPYHTKSNDISLQYGTDNNYRAFIYKLKKGKMYDMPTNTYGANRPVHVVIPESDLPALTGYQAAGTLRSLKNTKWEDAFWNDQNYSSKNGFKYYLCRESNMYLVVGCQRGYFNSLKLIEYEPVATTPKLYRYNDFDVQKYIPYKNLGRINIIGALPSAKPTVNRCDAEIRIGGYIMNTKVDVSVQGTSTALLPKKGFTLDILTADGSAAMLIQLGAWRPYNSYYMKAYMYDVTKTRDLLTNRIYEQMKLTLPAGRQRNWERAGHTFQFPTGAIGHIDGIPFEMYNNGEFYGIYVMNIKKTRDNYMMDKANSDQIWLDVGLTPFGGTVPWSEIEIRNPSGFDSGVAPPAGSVKTAIETFWLWCAGDWTNRTKQDIEDKIDIVSAIDTYLLHMLIHAWDGNGNNMFFSTYNGGVKWYYEIYDYNDTWGKSYIGIDQMYNDLTFGSQPNRADWNRIRVLYFEEIRYRWKMLVEAGVMTWENITNQMYFIFNQYGYDGIKKDLERWNLWSNNGVNTAGTTQMERYIKVAMASLAAGFDIYELKNPIIETDIFK